MTHLLSITTYLRTELKYAWFPTALASVIILLHDATTGIQHSGLVATLLIIGLVLFRPALSALHKSSGSWQSHIVYSATILAVTAISLSALDWLNT